MCDEDPGARPVPDSTRFLQLTAARGAMQGKVPRVPAGNPEWAVEHAMHLMETFEQAMRDGFIAAVDRLPVVFDKPVTPAPRRRTR